MNDINEIFRKFWPQTVHIIAVPAFFFSFMMIYMPFGASEYLGSMKKIVELVIRLQMGKTLILVYVLLGQVL